MDLTTLQKVLDAGRKVRVVCVGDVMIDRFVYGQVTRVSPEAPIPVLARSGETVMLGAAGNVARNIAALGGRVALVGLIGSDAEGQGAIALLAAEPGIDGGLVEDPSRPTTLKTRYVSGNQQLLRVDLEDCRAVEGEVADHLVGQIRQHSPGAGVIVLSDYGKGVVTEALIAACHDTGLPMIVDSKARHFGRYGPVAIIKPNAAELAFATGLPTGTDTEIELALAEALELCEAQAILVTRSAKGMSLARRGEAVRHFHGLSREVFDVSGAGDTAISALGLALASGQSLELAIEFAILASGVAVGKVGTATVSPDELIEAELTAHMADAEHKISTVSRMQVEIERWRSRGLRIGFTNGCFDILHKGHVAYLNQARSWCDRLIVGLNSDQSVRALKGEGRPVNDLEGRAMVLAGLACVDMVVPFDDDTPIRVIEAARPNVLIKGADYSEDQVVGGDLVKSWGGEVRLAQIVEGYSTTAAIARMADKESS